MNKIHILCS